ncbi:MAG: hypothetical protein ACK4YV_14520 [Emticicia sp.]
MKKNSKTDLIKEEINNYPGYPLYPASDDIYNQFRKDGMVDPVEATEMQELMDKAKVHTRNEQDFEGNFSERHLVGDGLDVPGSELDNQQENIGSEDEENNYYSIGGDNHSDLEEDRGE